MSERTLDFRKFTDGVKFTGRFTKAEWLVPQEGEVVTWTDDEGTEHSRPAKTQLYFEVTRTDDYGDGKPVRPFWIDFSEQKNSKLGRFLGSLADLDIFVEDPSELVTKYGERIFSFVEKNAKFGRVEGRVILVTGFAASPKQSDPFDGVDIAALARALNGKPANDILTSAIKALGGKHPDLTALATSGTLVDELCRRDAIDVDEDGHIVSLVAES